MVRIDQISASLTYTLLLQSRRASPTRRKLGAGVESKPNFFELPRRIKRCRKERERFSWAYLAQ